jgi:outer membrane protein assembly factor BamA
LLIRCLALLGLFSATALHVQAAFVVREIDIRGLKSTNRWVVERELYFQVGDTITNTELDAAHKRLHNLKVFNDAELTADTTGRVVVELSEAWPILPEVSVRLSRGDFSDVFKDSHTFWNNLEVAVGVRDLNFRGNASELFAFTKLGTSSGFFVGYQTRWLSPRVPLAVRARVQYLEVTDRHAAVLDSSRKMRDDGVSLEAGTRAGARERIGLGAAYQRVKQEPEWPAEGRDFNTVWLSPFAILDHRDLEWWPSRGSLAEIRGDFGFGTEQFIRSQYELRGFLPLKSWYPLRTRHRPPVLAVMVATAATTFSTPSFAHYYAGFEDGYRGYRYDRSEATGLITGQAEWRFPITPEGTYNVPLIGHWGRRWPIGMAGVLFVQRAELQLHNRRTELLGYGGGIYLRVPYVQIIELASARNKEGKPEFTLKLGVSF